VNVNLMVPGGMGAAASPGSPGFTESTASNPYPQGQCTFGVWQYVYQNFQIVMPDMPGNATDWVDDANKKGWKVTQTPSADTIVCWHSTSSEPFGHVAFVTGVQTGTVGGVGPHGGADIQQKPQSFAVDEYNFSHALEHDTRTIQMSNTGGFGNAGGIAGFIEVPGVAPGAQLATPSQISISAPPWFDSWATGIQNSLTSAENQAQSDLMSAWDKAKAIGTMAAGAGMAAGGAYLLVKSRVPFGATSPTQPRTAARKATSDVGASATQKYRSGRLSEMTPGEHEWLQGHAFEAREGVQARRAAAGQTPVPPTQAEVEEYEGRAPRKRSAAARGMRRISTGAGARDVYADLGTRAKPKPRPRPGGKIPF
jgi:surface antigen